MNPRHIIAKFYLLYGTAITCDAETTSSENGITYSWPRTFGGETASLMCPTRSIVLVMRNCSSDGLWQMVADDGCDTVNEQLNQLNESFANVRLCLIML